MGPEGKLLQFKPKETDIQPARVIGIAVPREGTNMVDLITDHLPGVKLGMREDKIIVTRLMEGNKSSRLIRYFRENTPRAYVWMLTHGVRVFTMVIPTQKNPEPFQDPA